MQKSLVSLAMRDKKSSFSETLFFKKNGCV